MKGITILTLALFISSFFYQPSIVYGREQKTGRAKVVQKSADPYAKISEQKLLEMAQKDYKTALRIAIEEGSISSEQEVFEIISKARGRGQISETSKAALEKRGIKTKPSDYIGQTKYKMLLGMGFDIDKVGDFDGESAARLLKEKGFFPNSQKDAVVYYRELLNHILSLIIKSAHARSSSTTTPVTSTTGRSSYVVTTDTGTSSGGSASTYRMDEATLSAYEELYDQPSIADTWDSMKAAETKGYDTMSNQIRHKKNTAMLVNLAAMVLIAWGMILVTDSCYDKTDELGGKRYATELESAMSSLKSNLGVLNKNLSDTTKPYTITDLSNAEKLEEIRKEGDKGEKLANDAEKYKKLETAKATSAECKAAGCDSACNKYTENDMIGYGMMAAGAGLLLYGMNLLGDAAQMEDEASVQKQKNTEIDKARADMLNREKKTKAAKEKIIKYRQRSKQLQKAEEEARRQQLMDAAGGTR